MPQTTSVKWPLRAAAVTAAAAVALGTFGGLAHAAEPPLTALTSSAPDAAHDFEDAPLGGVTAADIAAELHTEVKNVQYDPSLFSLMKVAKQRKISLPDLLKKVAPRSHGFTAAQLGDLATAARYTVDDIPAVGAVAHWNGQSKAASGKDESEISFGRSTLPFGESGYTAYVSRVYHAVGGEVMLEIEGLFLGEAGAYGKATIKASDVGRFIHLAKDPAPLPPMPAPPSSPGTTAEQPERELKDDYPADLLAKEHGFVGNQPEINAKILQCGMFATWRVADSAGMTKAEFDAKRQFLRLKIGAKSPTGTAALDDDIYTELGYRVDDKPAVGAMATWEANAEISVGGLTVPLQDPGHAAYVSRVYLINEEDEAAAEQLAADDTPDYRALNELLDRAKASKGKKVPFVLLEDYNGFGGTNKYGVKLLPAKVVHHFIHLAGTAVLQKMTPGETVESELLRNPRIGTVLGKPVGEPKVERERILQKMEHGELSYYPEERRSSYGSDGATAKVGPDKTKRIKDKVTQAIALYKQRITEPGMRQRLEKLIADAKIANQTYNLGLDLNDGN